MTRTSDNAALCYFNPHSLAGATMTRTSDNAALCYFNPHSLTGATILEEYLVRISAISIHAPSRERHFYELLTGEKFVFQSTLPCGSDVNFTPSPVSIPDFNPRSLAGATICSLIA